ncbi:hypothetical protein [Streptomyces sp. NBRC 110465]|uniref:hypothetical protein n=1 Tax=Streptomyces sp. NBRC 110465 TaxID=1897621 RepID=UPI0011612BB5|nr:hypothetical protein [Streptomyces sp. NBRC 110465]
MKDKAVRRTRDGAVVTHHACRVAGSGGAGRLLWRGRLVIAIALCCHAAFGLMTIGFAPGSGAPTGGVPMVAGVLVIAMNRPVAGRRQRRSAQ